MSIIIYVVRTAFQIYRWLLLARIIISWVNPNPYYHPAIRAIYDLTEPALRPCRSLLPAYHGIDFSPMIAFFVLGILERLVFGILFGILY